MEYDTSLADEAYQLADRWDAARDTPAEKLPFSESDISHLNSNQKSKLNSHIAPLDQRC
jgi:leukotriene-A4 hydrolase